MVLIDEPHDTHDWDYCELVIRDAIDGTQPVEIDSETVRCLWSRYPVELPDLPLEVVEVSRIQRLARLEIWQKLKDRNGGGAIVSQQ